MPAQNQENQTCCNCEEKQTEIIKVENDSYCEDCFNESFCHCDSCGDLEQIEDSTYIESASEIICHSCLQSNYFCCADCHEYAPNEESLTVNNSYSICTNCYEYGDYTSCYDCGAVTHYENTIRHGDEYFCEDCDNQNGKIHSYSYEPTLNFHHIKNGVSCFTTSQPKTKNTLYLGVELEIDSFDYISTTAECAKETANDETLFYNKSDGSLRNGYEIVTHPFTMDYFRQNKERYHKRIKTALKHGFRSHDVKTCGMHIHVSKDALSSLDIFKIVHFMYSNVDFVKIISNRTWDQINDWCSLDINRLIHGLNNPEQKVEKICEVAKRKGGTPKYVGLNLAKDKTIEFRIFRGTLNWATYQKNIQFVDALINWIKTTNLQQITNEFAVLSFLDFLCKNQTDYNHLILFIFNRFYAFDVHEKKPLPLRKIFKHFDLLSRMNNKQLMKQRSN